MSIAASVALRPGAARRGPAAPLPRVPWSTVLPLAVPLCLVGGFWTAALRTSVGSVERTSAPFAGLVRESALLLPVYVLAVLVALGLVQRRLGRDPRGFREVAATALLVVALGTLTGVAELVGNAAYDYRLELRELTAMPAMSDGCSAACTAASRHATLALQERTVVVGGLLVLLTATLVVTWLVAARGGRIRTVPARGERTVALLDRLGSARLLLVATLAGSAAVHAAVVPEHLAEWRAAGFFFAGLVVVQLALAAAVLVRRPARPLLWAGLLVSAATLVLWAVSRSVGLPIGPEPGVAEPVGLADVAAGVLEVLTVAAAISLLAGRRPRHHAVAGHRARLVLVAVLAVTALGLGGTDLAWLRLGADPGAGHMGAGAAGAVAGSRP